MVRFRSHEQHRKTVRHNGISAMTGEVTMTLLQWDREADVVVLGSGGAAMTAAISAHDFGAGEVVILEKSGMVGGTTAMSGGMLWIIEQGPYYAVKMEAGALGTAGGPKTSADAQVLDWHGEPILGLYAAGNAMAAVLADVYGGAGGTLGPGMAFGYIAGKHLASASTEEKDRG